MNPCQFLQAAALALLAIASSFASAADRGWSTFTIGRFKVTALSDGHIAMKPEQLLLGLSRAEIRRELEAASLGPVVATSNTAYLVDTGAKRVLIDTGAGTSGALGPDLGHLVPNLVAAGYRPGEVDEVYITHAHPDHTGGLVAFPNARWRIDRREPVPPGPWVRFAAGETLTHGIRALEASGHTPGHTVYVVESEGEALWIVGDLIHVGAVQLPHPEVTIRFDTDATAAARARAAIFGAAADQHAWIAAAHLPFPGVGRLHRSGTGYTFEAR